MIEESKLIPYAPSFLPGSRVLVMAPHPDDEILGCGGVLALMATQPDKNLNIVMLTGGEAQGEASERIQESKRALELIGVSEPLQLNFEDRSLFKRFRELCLETEKLFRELKPELVLCPSPCELNPDHRACAMAAFFAARHAESIRWLAAYEVSGPLRPNLLVDVTGVWEDVLAAAKQFKSQEQHAPYTQVMDAMATARRLTLPRSVEKAEAYYLLSRETFSTISYQEWAAKQGPSIPLELPAEKPAPAIIALPGSEPISERISREIEVLTLPSNKGITKFLKECQASHLLILEPGYRLLPPVVDLLWEASVTGREAIVGAILEEEEGVVLDPLLLGTSSGIFPLSSIVLRKDVLLNMLQAIKKHLKLKAGKPDSLRWLEPEASSSVVCQVAKLPPASPETSSLIDLARRCARISKKLDEANQRIEKLEAKLAWYRKASVEKSAPLGSKRA